MGLCLIKPVGGSIALADLAVLGSLGLVAILGAYEARRLVHHHQILLEADSKVVKPRWMTVIVQSAGPADTAGVVVIPKSPPRNDPERRSLTRRARERKTVGASAR